MEKFKEDIIPFLENGYIRYLADGTVKSMSVEYFQQNFTKIAATELTNIGHHYFYFQNKENPELVMRFRITQLAGFSAIMIPFKEYESQFAVMGKL